MAQGTVWRNDRFLQTYVMNGICLVYKIYVETDICFAILKYQIKSRLLTQKKRK